MSGESPFKNSPFNRARATRTSTNSSISPNNSLERDEGKMETSNPRPLPRIPRARFQIGDELDSDEQDRHGSPITTLENIFHPTNEVYLTGIQPSKDINISHEPNVKREDKMPFRIEINDMDNSQVEENKMSVEDQNQLTVQSILTNFEAPIPKLPKSTSEPIRRKDQPSFEENTWLRKIINFFKKGRKEVNPILFKRVVKSSIAFFLASLMVIIEPVSKVLGNGPFIAPVVVIVVDSARTVGAQLEIFLLSLLFFLFGLIVYIIGFGFFILFNQNNPFEGEDLKYISDGAFILAIFLYFTIFILGWLKVKFAKLSRPIVLTAILLLNSFNYVPFGETVFNIQSFTTILVPSLIGLSIALIVNGALWPESASQDLGKSFELTLDSLHSTLNLLTDCFLLKEDTLHITPQNLEELHSRSMTAVTVLIKASKEARYEYAYSIHPPTDYKPLIDLALLLQQHLGGFNLAVQRQRQLLALKKELGEPISPIISPDDPPTEIKAFSLPPSPSELSLNRMGGDIIPITPVIDPDLARNLIHEVLLIVKDPLLKLSRICLEVLVFAREKLEEEETAFQEKETAKVKEGCNCKCSETKEFIETFCKHEYEILKGIDTLQDALIALQVAISEFERAEGECLKTIHRQILFTPHQHAPFPEPMLVVFSGIFTMKEFGKQLCYLLDEEQKFLALRPPVKKRSGFLGTGPPVMSKPKKWWRPKVSWMKWLRGNKPSDDPQNFISQNDDIDRKSFEEASETFLNGMQEFGDENIIQDPIRLPAQRWTKTEYASRYNESTSKPSPFQKHLAAIRLFLWRSLQFLSTYEFKYAIKFVLVVALLSFPAYVPTLAPKYFEIRGQWGAVAAMLIISETIGATLQVGLIRLAGTLIGAAWGYLTYLASNNTQNIYLVVFMIWIYMAPSWYFILSTSFSKIGFNGLIAYTIVVFIGYSHSSSNDVLMFAFYRALSVVIGLTVAMIVSSTVWPFSARRELRKLISILLGDMGMTFGKVAALCMSSHESQGIQALESQIRHSQRKIQKRILDAKSLLLFATKEPRLKGPFPVGIYSEQIRVLQDILDQLVAMASAVAQISPRVQETVIFPFNSYRKFMVSSVILYFYVLSGALRSKTPLPPYPPPIHAIRYQLMLKTRAAMVKKYRRMQASMSRLGSFNVDSTPEMLDPAQLVKDNLKIQIESSEDKVKEQENLIQEFNHIYWYSYMAGLVRLFEDVELMGHNVANLVGEMAIPVIEHVVEIPEDTD